MALLDTFRKSKKTAPTTPAQSPQTARVLDTQRKPDTDAKKTAAGPAKKHTDKTHTVAYYSHLLIKPHVTEKSTHASGDRKYIFKVPLQANKQEIAAAIFAIFEIKPMSVRIIRHDGKKVRIGLIRGKRKNTKKAIVTLPHGKTLDIYEGL